MIIITVLRGLLIVSLSWAALASPNASLSLYQQADQALRAKQMDQYQHLRQQLAQHPLAIYLDYRYLHPRVSKLSATQVNEFKERANGSPLARRLAARYLTYAGQKRQWQNFLAVSPNEPSGTELRCYYHRALLAQGQKQLAFQGAAGLWLSGNSQPDACDPLFTAWAKAGLRTNQHIWGRMLLAFDAKKGSLLSYLSQKLTGEFQDDGERLRAVYYNPRLLSNTNTYSKGPRAKEIVSAGLRKLARTSPSQAIRYWRTYEKKLSYGTSQASEIKRQLVLYAYLREEKAASQWADQQLRSLQVDRLTEMRLRQYLKQGAWAQLKLRLKALSQEAQQSERWQYWLAKLEAKDGLARKSKQRLQAIASKRSYYSYLAATELGVDYQLEEQQSQPTPLILKAIQNDTGLARVKELMAASELENANSEWIYLLRRTSNSERLALAHLAKEQGWWHLAVSAAIRAQAWHELHLRFPQGYRNDFEQFAQMRQLDLSLLMAIARRESTFNPYARSHAGARGLMQLMPATAMTTARKIRLRYKGVKSLNDPNVNIRLGSAYIKQLLEQFRGNKLLAIAAYNAGPSRVKSWLNDGKALPFDIWVETIPFRETREYVQAVLAYQVIYQQKLAPELAFAILSDREEKATY